MLWENRELSTQIHKFLKEKHTQSKLLQSNFNIRIETNARSNLINSNFRITESEKKKSTTIPTKKISLPIVNMTNTQVNYQLIKPNELPFKSQVLVNQNIYKTETI